MLFKFKCWLNEATREYPRLRNLLLKAARSAGVMTVGAEKMLREHDRMRGSGLAFFWGKYRLTTPVKPSVRRKLETLYQPFTTKKVGLLREHDEVSGYSFVFLSGKYRLVTRVKPSVRRNLEALDKAFTRGAE